MGTGALAYAAIAKQNSFGTSTNSYHYFEFLSESIITTVEPIVLESLQNRFDEGQTIEGYEEIEGDVTMSTHPLHVGHFLRGLTNASTVTAVGSTFSHKFLPAQTDFDTETTLPPYTLQIYRDTTESYQYTDVVVNNIEFTIDAGGVLEMSAGVLARTTSLMTATGPSFVPSATPWAWSVMSGTIVGSAFVDFESLTISVENQVEGVKVMDGTKRISGFKRSGFRQVRISGTLDFPTNSQWEVFKNQSENRLVMYFAPMVSSGATLQIDVPNMRYATLEPQVGGPGRISVDFEAHGKFDTTSNYAIEFTLVNTFADYS